MTPFDTETLAKEGARLSRQFGFYQEALDKVGDYRVYVIGSTIHACRISSPEGEVGPLDYRASGATLRHESVTLPPPINASLRSLCRRLGVDYAAIDLAETESGDLFFLEANINGQWLWIEQHTGTPITRDVARLLMRLGVP